MHAPRDVVDFFNACLEFADGKEKIGPQIVKTAEAQYSNSRLVALFEEWNSVYPNLKLAIELLKKSSKTFLIQDIETEKLNELAYQYALQAETEVTVEDEVRRIFRMYYDQSFIHPNDVRLRLIYILYQVGAVGIKIASFNTTSWSFIDASILSFTDLTLDSKIEICPAFYRVLGVSGVE